MQGRRRLRNADVTVEAGQTVLSLCPADHERSEMINLHLWLAPVRNLTWVAASFGYR